MKKLNWVFYELAFPWTMAAIWEARRRAGSENGKPRAGSVGDSKRGAREANGPIGNGEKVSRVRTVTKSWIC